MQVYLVGGAVRDKLLNRQVTERDWVVVGATAEQLIQQGYTQVGKDFPVFLHPKTQDEYALARTERKTGGGYTGFSCHASPEVTLEEDLLRRDLTINAMAETAEGKLIDPYHGLEDLNNRLLRHVSPAFAEDPLRIFRVARFAARYDYLGFTIAPQTMQLMQQMSASSDITHLSAERVWQETRRAIMEEAPQVYFQVLNQCGALKAWLPELLTLVPQATTTANLNRSAQLKTPLYVRWASLCWQLPLASVKALNSRLKVPNLEADMAELAVKFLPSLAAEYRNSDWLLAFFNTCDAWRRPERLERLLALLPVLFAELGPDYQKTINLALSKANAVDVQAIIAAGYQGPQIKQQLYEQRLKQIHQAVTNQSVSSI